jgi:protein involved in polysaccharide export with SLBB domain
MRILATLFSLFLLCGAGCHSTGPKFDPSQSTPLAGNEAFTPAGLTNLLSPALLQAPIEPFRLGPGDVIEAETIGESTGRSTMTVGPDGKIYYSLLAGISVWNLTLAETRTLLQREMAKFTRATPELVINLRTVGSKRIWVLGAVPGAGVFPLATPVTLLEAISLAGGLPTTGATIDDGADLQRSFVLRDGRLLPVDFERLFKRGDLSQNIYLQPDDFIYVPPANLPSVYVLGAVGSPNILPFSRDLTLARVIIMAGGTVKYGLTDKAIIIRGGLNQPKIAEVNYAAIVQGRAIDVRLEPGDVVYVPFTPFRKLAELVETVLDQTVRTTAANYGIYVADPNGAPVSISAPIGGAPSGGGISTGGSGGSGSGSGSGSGGR